MGLESGVYISDLNASNPVASDAKSSGDDHLRLIKSTVKATFPNITGAVTSTHTELNHVAGVTSAIQTQINAKAPVASPTFTGTATIPTLVVSTEGTAPTQTVGDNSAKLATTAFVANTTIAASLPAWQVISGYQLAVNGGRYMCNTTAAGFTVDLPESPSAGWTVSISDYAVTFATNNLTVGYNT